MWVLVAFCSGICFSKRGPNVGATGTSLLHFVFYAGLMWFDDAQILQVYLLGCAGAGTDIDVCLVSLSFVFLTNDLLGGHACLFLFAR